MYQALILQFFLCRHNQVHTLFECHHDAITCSGSSWLHSFYTSQGENIAESTPCWSVYEQNSIVNGVRVYDRETEWEIITNNGIIWITVNIRAFPILVLKLVGFI